MPVDPSRHRSHHHIEHCPDHHEPMEPVEVAEEAFPLKWVCPADGKEWTPEELASR